MAILINSFDILIHCITFWGNSMAHKQNILVHVEMTVGVRGLDKPWIKVTNLQFLDESFCSQAIRKDKKGRPANE